MNRPDLLIKFAELTGKTITPGVGCLFGDLILFSCEAEALEAIDKARGFRLATLEERHALLRCGWFFPTRYLVVTNGFGYTLLQDDTWHKGSCVEYGIPAKAWTLGNFIST